MKRNGKNGLQGYVEVHRRHGMSFLPLTAVWLTIEERDAIVKALWSAPCPNSGYREYLSALRKIKGDR